MISNSGHEFNMLHFSLDVKIFKKILKNYPIF